MKTRSPTKKGKEYFGDTTSPESFKGMEFELFKGGGFLDFLFESRLNFRVDTLNYSEKYNGGDFFYYRNYLESIGFLNAARETSSYAFDPSDPSRVTFDIINGPGRPVDFIDYVERVYFSDGLRILWSPATPGIDPAFAIQGLYEYLGRDVPDAEGFKFWLNSYDELNVPLVEIANTFIAIKAEVGSGGGVEADPTTNRDFVNYLYQSILERPADQNGLDFWTESLDNSLATRGEVLVQFVDVNWETDWYNAVTGVTQPFGGPNWIPLE